MASQIAAAWKRPASSADDPSKRTFLADRIQGAMGLAVYPQAQQIAPPRVLISPINRLFSVHQVHRTILHSFLKDGFDPERPAPGICVEVRSSEKLKTLIEYNENLAASTPLLPKVDPDHTVMYEALANTHYNVALRLVGKSAASPAGDLAILKEERPSLAAAAKNGHWWIVMPETLKESLKTDIATWRNQDQNENQTMTDGEMVRMSLNTVKTFLSGAKYANGKATLPLAAVVSATVLQTPLALSTTVMGGFTRFVCSMAQENTLHLVEEFLTFWTCSVDPKTIAVPHFFFEHLSKSEALVGQPLLRMHMAMSMYCMEGSQSKASPAPAQAGLITIKCIESLNRAEVAFTVTLASAALQKVHGKFKSLLAEALPVHTVRDEVVIIGSLIVRLLFGKPLDSEQLEKPGDPCSWLKCPVKTGQVTEDKINRLLGWWSKHLDAQYPTLKFSEASGLKEFEPIVALVHDVVFDVPGSSSDAPPSAVPPRKEPMVLDPDEPKQGELRVGDEVLLRKRITAHLPLPNHPEHRKDLGEKTEATVVSLPTAARPARVEIKAVLLHKGIHHDVRAWVHVDNLVAADADFRPSEVKDQLRHKAGAELSGALLADQSWGNEVSLVEKWQELLGHSSQASQLHRLKAEATFAMSLLRDSIPPLKDGDDVRVVHRKNHAGAQRTEVWTTREFRPNQLLMVPWSLEIKDRLWTREHAVSLGTPPHTVPGCRVLAVDGRNHSHLEHAAPQEHVAGATGELFWCIQRTSDRKLCNLLLRHCSVAPANTEMRLSLGVGMEPLTAKMSLKSLPSVPILYNPKVIQAHTRLVALDDPVVNRAREEDKRAKEEKEKEEANKRRKVK